MLNLNRVSQPDDDAPLFPLVVNTAPPPLPCPYNVEPMAHRLSY
jgi:hypothetical protein